MSIKKVEMWTVKCDHPECDNTSGDGLATCAWSQKFAAINEAIQELRWIQDDGLHYCPDCTKWNETETVRVPKQKPH